MPVARLGQQPGLVKTFPQALRFAAGHAWVRGGIENSRHVIVHAAVLSLSRAAHTCDQLGWCPPRHLLHAYMVAGMHAPWHELTERPHQVYSRQNAQASIGLARLTLVECPALIE